MTRQESVVASLSELRGIEQQRIADELAARAAEAAARERARLDDEARIAAAARAVLDAALAEAARAQAEAAAMRRADELAIACAEATERARVQAGFEAERMANELRVRREEIARTRPLAMIGMIAALVVAGVVLGVVILQQRSDLDAREAAIRGVTDRAERLRNDSTELGRAARDLQGEVDKRNAELTAQQKRIDQLQAAASSPPHGIVQPVTHAPPHGTPAVAPPPLHPPIVIDDSCSGSVLCHK